jgi:hypothetical protein
VIFAGMFCERIEKKAEKAVPEAVATIRIEQAVDKPSMKAHLIVVFEQRCENIETLMGDSLTFVSPNPISIKHLTHDTELL